MIEHALQFLLELLGAIRDGIAWGLTFRGGLES
jgi:hypothetical protein